MSQAATHTINGDIGDPCAALAFARECRGMNDGIVGELEILAGNMTSAGVGPKPIAEIRVLCDAGRTYSASNRKSEEVYARHVVTQAEIAGDEDLRDTVKRTYLDTAGSGGVASPQPGGKTRTIRAADCNDPSAAVRLMDAVASLYQALQTSVDQAKSRHQQQGVSDDPVQFLAAQLEHATTIATQAAASARTFRAHVRRRNDTVGKDKSLGGTQSGKYLDPTKA